MAESVLVLKLRAIVAGILSSLVENCHAKNLFHSNARWFGEQIGFLVEHNLLTYHEIDTLFGWKESGHAENFNNLYAQRGATPGLPKLSTSDFQQRVMSLVGVVAVKYRLHVAFAAEAPSVQVEVLAPVTLATAAAVTKVVAASSSEQVNRFDLLYRPISDFPAFEDMTVRAINGLKDGGGHYLGDLVRQTEQEFLRTPNLGKVSVAEVKKVLNSLQLDLSFGCLTSEEQSEFDARKWLNENAETPLSAHHRYGSGEEWQAPHALLKQLHQLGITERTELATCPLDVLAPFLVSKGDLERMLNPLGSSNLGLVIPRHLKSNVRVYIPVSGEDSPRTTE